MPASPCGYGVWDVWDVWEEEAGGLAHCIICWYEKGMMSVTERNGNQQLDGADRYHPSRASAPSRCRGNLHHFQLVAQAAMTRAVPGLRLD